MGYTTYTCTVCGDCYDSDWVDPLGHAYEITEAVEGNCQQQGYVVYTCANCGDFFEEYREWGDHQYTVERFEPTCYAYGYLRYTCTLCDYSYDEDDAPPLGHDYEVTVIAPTCTEWGYTDHRCIRCDENYQDCWTVPEHKGEPTGYCTECGAYLSVGGSCGDSLNWELQEGGILYIWGEGDMERFNDPEETPWQPYREIIYGLIVEEGVTSISDEAFEYCGVMTSVSLPDTLTSIGRYAFAYTGLTSVEWPATMPVIAEGVFAYCSDLAYVSIPEGVREIEQSAFMFSGITELKLPEGVQRIGSSAFYGSAVATVHIPTSLYLVEDGAFGNCHMLRDVYYAGTGSQWNKVDFTQSNDCLTNASIHLAQLSTPAVTKLENVAGGIKLTWGKVDGAERYRVYVKENGKWKNLGNTTGNTFTYTAAESGRTYTFTVRCVSADNKEFTSDFNASGWQQTFVAAPAVTKLENVAGGVKITWDAVPGAAKYRVFVKNAKGGWSTLGNTTGTGFTYTAAESGKTYTFTVRCLSADGKSFTSAYNTSGWKHTYTSYPQVTALESAASGVKITWDALPGAGKYRVYVQTGSGWSKVGDTAGTSFTWTGAALGKTYTFTVRAMNAEATAFVSGYNTAGWSHKYSPAPAVTKLENASTGVKITWGAVNGAEKYRIFVKSGSSWKTLADVTGTSYTWTGAESGKTYTFTVRCVSADGKSFTSSYNTSGWKHTFVAQPGFTGAQSAAAGLKLTWGAVNGAGKYRVYVKTTSGWTKLADVTGTSYTWTGAETGKSYTFTIRAMNAEGTAVVSAYNAGGWKYTYSPAPEITKLASASNGVKITWGAVNGAAEYRVFVKSGSSWKTLADVTGTSYTWTGAEKGKTYIFTVRCVSADGKSFTSSYNTSGWSYTYQ